MINSLKISGAIGEPVKMVAEMVFQDGSISTADTAMALAFSFSTARPFVYADGVYRYDSTEGSLTSSVNEPIQAFELEINNNLITDAGARQLGTRVFSRIPPSPRREVKLKITQRFDTSTTWTKMTQNTASAVQLFFRGDTISAEYFRDLTVTLPSVRAKNTEPLVEGPNDVLESEIEFDVLVSGGATSTARELWMSLRNGRTTAY